MAPPTKPSSTPTAARRKSSKLNMIVTLKLSPKLLQRFQPVPVQVEEEPSSNETPAIIPKVEPATTSSNGDVLMESASNTPAAAGTPISTSMPPPTEGVKKKGVKRSAAIALGPDGLPVPKVRGKPGPKKKARLEDGSIDHSATAPRAANGTAHKLGPKANQGAINAGLRALDRSGKPCRKWAKGSFKLKSFTGVIWEIPRWKAPPKATLLSTSEDSVSGESSKENKDNSQLESEKSNSGIDVELGSPASSPAPSTLPMSTDIAGPAVRSEVLNTESAQVVAASA